MTDHNSSPRAVAEPAIDVADMYAFPSPSRPGQLVLAMTVFPNARPGALFSDAVDYRFRLRPVTVPAGGPAARFDVGTDEYDLTCTFTTPVGTDDARQPGQEGTCTLPNGATVTFRVDEEAQAWRDHAAARYDELLASHSEAFADHAAEFWCTIGGDRGRALRLARENLALRPTARARGLVRCARGNAED